MSAFTQIVRTAMHDNGAAEDALRTDKFDLLVGDGSFGVTLRVGLEVA